MSGGAYFIACLRVFGVSLAAERHISYPKFMDKVYRAGAAMAWHHSHSIVWESFYHTAEQLFIGSFWLKRSTYTRGTI